MALEDDFKDVMANWTSGVSVVTTEARGLVYGLTVSSFTSVSLDPPLVLVCLSNHNRMQLMIQDSQAFTVSILSSDMEDASGYFASPGREPTTGFVGIEGDWTASGQPVVQGAMGYVECKLHQVIPGGDHVIIVGEVLHAHSRDDAEPLVYCQRGYRRLATGDPN